MHHKKALTLIITGLLLILIAGTAWAARKPSISWTPSELPSAGIQQGSSTTYTVVLKNIGILPILNTKKLRIVAEGDIAPFVTITQPKFPKIFKRKMEVSLNLTLSIPIDAPAGIKNGSIALKRVGTKGNLKRIPRAASLPVEFNVWPLKVAELAGISISSAYPPEWYVTQTKDDIVFRNVEEPGELSDFTLQTQSFLSVSLRSNENPQLLPIDQWFDQVMRPVISETLVAYENRIVAGHNAIYAEVSEIGGRHAHIYVLRNSDVIEITYGLYSPQFISTYESILQTILIND